MTDDATVFHIEPAESFRLGREWPWALLAFAIGGPAVTAGVLAATVGWSDFVVSVLVLGGVSAFVGALRAGVRQERRRDALAVEAYRALPRELLEQAVRNDRLSERTRVLIAGLLADGAAVRRAAPDAACNCGERALIGIPACGAVAVQSAPSIVALQPGDDGADTASTAFDVPAAPMDSSPAN